jgi:hypothetical protein
MAECGGTWRRVERQVCSLRGAWERMQDQNDLKLHRSTDLGPRRHFWWLVGQEEPR